MPENTCPGFCIRRTGTTSRATKQRTHAVRYMSDLAFRAANSLSCLELIGVFKGFKKI